jgi:hypothetical protein
MSRAKIIPITALLREENSKLRSQVTRLRRVNNQLRGKLMTLLHMLLGRPAARHAVATGQRPARFDPDTWEEILALLDAPVRPQR